MRATPFVAVVVLAFGCASPRNDARTAAALEATRQREPFLPLVSEKKARATMPGYRGRAAPNLVRVAAHMPKTWKAEMAAWQALGQEGTLDKRLLSEVFYVVSESNDCFY